MKIYVIALLLFLPIHLFAGFMQVNRYNVSCESNNATMIATIDVAIEDLLENELSVYIDNKIYTLPLLYMENRGNNDYGVIFQNDSIMVSVSVYQNQVSGMIKKNGFHYSIERDSTGSLYLFEIDMCSVSDANETLEPPQYNKSRESQIYNTQDTIVRVAVFYTSNISTSFKQNIVSHVNQTILQSNASFMNSSIGAQLELVYLGETSYASINFDDDLANFTLANDEHMNEVHHIREAYAADVCVLLTASSGFCGLGWISADYDYAFCAVQASTSCLDQYSFVHEIGHIVGCDHDEYIVQNTTPAYAHGYVHLDGGNSWRTIMAYDNLCDDSSCRCDRIPYWSNPDVTYNGIATGNNKANNARIWNERVNTVSNFFHFPSALLLTETLLNNSNYAYARAIDSISTKGDCIIDRGTQVKMQVTERVVLKPGFHAKAGSNLHVKIETPTANIASAPQRVAPTTPSDDTNSTDEVVTNNGLESTENEVIVSTSIYTISGQLIQTISSGQHDATHLPNGMYILQHRMSDGSMRSEKIANVNYY